MNNDLNNSSENNNSTNENNRYFTNTDNQFRVKEKSNINADEVFNRDYDSIQQSLYNMANDSKNEDTTQQNNDTIIDEHDKLEKLRKVESIKNWIIYSFKALIFLAICIASLVGIIFVVNTIFFNNNSASSKNSVNSNSVLIENAIIMESRCLNYNCNFKIKDSTGNKNNYTLGIENEVLFGRLINYNNYVKINVYYNEDNSNKIIVDYNIFLKSTNEDISSIKTEDQLREKLGLFTLGTHTEVLRLTKIVTTGSEKDGTNSIYLFADKNNYEYKMTYMNGKLDLFEGQNYNITFEVKNGIKEYEFTIISLNE